MGHLAPHLFRPPVSLGSRKHRKAGVETPAFLCLGGRYSALKQGYLAPDLLAGHGEPSIAHQRADVGVASTEGPVGLGGIHSVAGSK